MTVDDLPNEIKVGYIDYAIVDWEHAQADSADRYGETDRVRRIIRIDSSFSSQQTCETLLHEILHTAWEMWNMPKKLPEEKIISSMAKSLATIWRDNPEVFSWIAEHLK